MLLSRLYRIQRYSNTTSIISNSYIFKHINTTYLTYPLKHIDNRSCIFNTYRYIHYSNNKDNELDRILNNCKSIESTKQFNVYVDKQLAKNNISIYDIATLMQKSSKSKFRLSEIHIKKITIRINKELKPIKMISLSQMCYGLKEYDNNNDNILSLLKAFTIKLGSINALIDTQGIGNILYGLQKMDSKSIEVQGVLQAMIPHIKICKDIFTPQNIGNTLYGLQKMDSDNIQVQRVLQAMIPHIKSCMDYKRWIVII